ncbi:uncharacterized protein MYCFIDRAFT_38040 [Pseudocercospora fijiensis CIRAD86]|uniref:histidine kinase n=1 Tax=Pseudocercospora fijiensis (strain CIRAD86) TaxID=383855 RepID=M3AR25_PSEFD|nr:uncharacterized protein MYCFIDRAFT_38040 [Pseudocercospora fijiensis CIRAD86]EME79882.1 hypothetical protein MYCFIDRAFT_38040 [Pseudocercospora fijiensis CIRAD86]
MGGSDEGQQAIERQTICFPRHGTQDVLQAGHPGFNDEIARLYSPAENNALESLLALKADLRLASTDDFWTILTEGMSKLVGADICFVMKRVLVDDQESAVEMPPIGEPGSCLMAAALHYHANDGSKSNVKSTKFHAYGCPCAYMRHDKVFLIPERLGDFITNNPNQLPTPCEAYLALPLFAQGKCFGHFGTLFSVERARQRQLSWAFMEMLLHSLEDLICQRFLQGANFIRPQQDSTPPSRVIPHAAITAAQSLRPYAGSLSHELRTPMQGIVGMLDVMYATVQEAVDVQGDPRLRKVFEELKDQIETVQDSSRRAVEAADNVVHAYDMDMSVPEAPAHLLEEPSDSHSPYSAAAEKRPDILVAGSNLPLSRPNKRRREGEISRSGSNASGSVAPGTVKRPRTDRTLSTQCTHCSEVKEGVQEAQIVQEQSQENATIADVPSAEDAALAAGVGGQPHRVIAPGLRHTSLRELLQHVINEGLKVGGRPDSAMAQETEHGEIIEVRTRGSDGTLGQKFIEWRIDPNVPNTMFVDEKDLSKLISCVFLNAIKFTQRIDGRITVDVRMTQRGRYISIKMADNGPGIPAAFLPRLFKPFSQQNASTTRSSEGLGLGLMVAKGIARKLGGDLNCTKALTEGPDRGSEFEIKVPLHAGETISRPESPFGSPLPRKATVAQPESPLLKPLPAAPGSPRKLSRALQDVVGNGPARMCDLPSQAAPSTPPSPKTQVVNVTVPRADTDSPPTTLSTPSPPAQIEAPRPRFRKSVGNPEIDRDLAKKYPLTFLVAEDNKINRKLLVSMLGKFGYRSIVEAHDGAEAVRQMSIPRAPREQIDVVLMDLWMPLMDGYEATERILSLDTIAQDHKPTVLAVTADVTDSALERAAEVGMKGFMTKPYKLHDLQRLIMEYCAITTAVQSPRMPS